MVRKLWRALALAMLVVMVGVQPMLAAAPDPGVNEQVEQRYGLQCVDGVCRAELDLGMGAEMLPQGVWLTVMQSALRVLPGGMGIEIQDDVTITMPAGQLELVDAELVLTLDKMGKVATLRGSAAAPVPTFGLLGDLQLVTPARVTVGYDYGSQLTGFDAPLQGERRYLFIDAEAGLHLIAQDMAMRADEGQRATLILDVAQPMVFVDGQLTIYTNTELAFLREALGPLGEMAWMPTDLPLHQNVVLNVQGQVGRDVEPKLTLGGGYRMDGGLVGRWLRLDATPLLAQGQAVISPDGVLVEGRARSALQPERWFDGGAQAQLFVPFAAPETASVTVGADVALPAMDVAHDATATLAGEAGWLERTGEAALAGMHASWQEVVPSMQDGLAWMGDGIGTGWTNAQMQWCAVTGLCDAPIAGEGPTQVAAAK